MLAVRLLRDSPAHRLRSRKRPSISFGGRDLLVLTCASSVIPGLLCSPGGQELVLHDFQSVGEVAALKRDRLVVWAVDEHPLVGIQTHATRAGESPLSSALSH